MYNILKLKLRSILKTFTKETTRALKIMILGFILIIAIITLKYKPVYEVKISGKTLGYIENKKEFQEQIKQEILNQEGENIDNITLNEEPKYELKLSNKKQKTNEEEIIANLQKNNTTITYKYYVVALNSESKTYKTYVNTIEQAEEVVKNIKEDYDNDLELDLTVSEEYTENKEDIKTDTIEVAESNLEENVQELIDEKKAKEAIATINGINIGVLPVSGIITSRFGESSSIRSSTHTGLDIACSKGTDIKVVADGTVTFAAYNGSYGYLVKVDHGNNVETWYAHCNVITANVGDKVEVGDKIAEVGSTGNSTGPHLHLEIRINGVAVNPQKYIY